MVVEIFHEESAPEDRILTLRDDGKISYRILPSYPPLKPIVEVMTVDAAKARWPSYAAAIDKALSDLSRSN